MQKKNKLINRYPGSKQLAHKDVFSAMMKFAMDVASDDYDFVPPTFTLPGRNEGARLNEYMANNKNATYIAKPQVGAQGEGMALFNEFKDIPYSLENKDIVIQRYLDKPLTLDGIKFDLRVYVVVCGLDDMKAYICDEGLARFCTVSSNYEIQSICRLNMRNPPEATSRSHSCI
jgi:hypothetical protein